MTLQMKCHCGTGSLWRKQAPEDTAKYRVECPTCHKFAKWGAQSELDRLIDSGAEGAVVKYEPEPRGPTLDAFIDDE